MKKTTKGAIAAGAAAVLLAGGAGSFAAWNASSNTSGGGTVTAGSMSIEEVSGSSGWTWAGGGEFSPESDKIVPGDKVEYTATYKIQMEGTNLEAKLAPKLGELSEGGLAKYLELDPAEGTQTTFKTENGTLDETVEFTTVITFKGDTQNTDGAGETASLSGSSVTLEQVAPASNNS